MNVTNTPPLRNPCSYGFATVSSLGSNIIIPANVSGVARFRILSGVVLTTTATSITFLSGSTPISASFPLGANGGFSLPMSDYGWFETNPGEALNLSLSAPSTTAVQLTYLLLPT
jgi:hypothetical protein